MNIRKIHLQNVKSYADETINFKEGINLIGGPNGAGKTTIIESIGYGLFGKKPDYTFSEFVRRGARDGSITIDFEIDDIIYRIERTFSDKQSKDWNIYELESGRRIDLHGEEDIKKWLRKRMHLEQEDKIDKIFETVVGVEQGQFASPFMQTDRQRKDYFEPILKLDKYRKAYKNTGSVLRKFEDEITKIKHAVELNKQRIEKYDEKIDELKEIKIKIQEFDIKIKNNTIIKEGIEAELKQQENFKKKLDETQKELEKNTINIKSSEEKRDKNEEEIKESRIAYEIVEKTKAGKEKFEFLNGKIKELEAKQKEKIEVEKEKIEVERSIDVQNTKDTNLKEEESRLYKDISKREEDIQKLSEPIKIKTDWVKNISDEREKFENTEQFIEKLSGCKDIKKFISSVEKTGKHGEILNYGEIKKNRLEYERFNEEYERFNERRLKLEQSIETQNESLKKSKGGKCPFLNEQCKNIESGNLEDHFKDKLKILEKEIKKINGKINEVKNKKNDSEKFFFNIKKEIKKNVSEIGLKFSSAEKELTILEQKKKENEKRIKEMENRLNEINTEKKKLLVFSESQKGLLEKLTAKIEAYGDLDAKIENNKQELAKYKGDYDKCIANKGLAGKLNKLLEEKEKILKDIQKLNFQKQELEQELNKLRDKYDEEKLNGLKIKNKEIYEKLGKLNNEFNERRKDEKNLTEEIAGMDKIKAIIKEQEQELEKVQNAYEVFNFIRNMLNRIGPRIAKHYLGYISEQANRTYRAISGENVELVWDENYNIILKDVGKQRIFKQLSGGEQMTAAIAVRLAILKQFSKIRIGFFDEPTTHLDESRREQLAESIGHLRELERRWFDQLFVISHDDAFETITENVVMLKKDDGVSSKV